MAKCKYGASAKKRNIVEMAEIGDWLVGTGGADLNKSADHCKLIYAMRVDKIIPLVDYCHSFGDSRIDAKHDLLPETNRFALISNHYFYFGSNAIAISGIPSSHLQHPFEKTGPGYRSDFCEEFIAEFAEWLSATYKVGVHGLPCKPHAELKLPVCSLHVKHQSGTQ